MCVINISRSYVACYNSIRGMLDKGYMLTKVECGMPLHDSPGIPVLSCLLSTAKVSQVEGLMACFKPARAAPVL